MISQDHLSRTLFSSTLRQQGEGLLQICNYTFTSQSLTSGSEWLEMIYLEHDRN